MTATSLSDYITWESWYDAFKTAAGKSNFQLEENEDGTCIIDFLEHEPLKRAFRDGVDPNYLAKEYAAQFDFSKLVR